MHLLTYNMNKFKPGDLVEVVEDGWGCNPCLVGKFFVIKDVFQVHPIYNYTLVDQDKLYVDIEKNHRATSGVIREESFKLVERNLNVEKIIKQKNLRKMATSLGKGKSTSKVTAKEVRVIDSSLINKEEVFKMLALAESTGLPCLLVGNPGVAKTKTIIEYAKAWLNKDGNMTAEDFANKIYILETDEGTKSSEIKGIN